MTHMREIESPVLLSSIDELLNSSEFKKLADVFRVISFAPLEPYHLHRHRRIEMAYVKRGGCIVETEKESIYFKQDEMMIIASNVIHSFQAGANGCTLLQLEFPLNILNITSSMQQTELNTSGIFSTGNTVIKIVNNVRIMRSIQRIVAEMNAKNDYYRHLVIMYYAELFILIHRHLNESYLPMCNNEAITKAIKYIRMNYHKNISIKNLSAHTKVSDRYLRQLFSQYMSITPIDYLNQTRINKAVELLRISDMSIKEICYKCGFKSPQYFSRAFKLQLGVTPTEIRYSQGTEPIAQLS